MRDLRLINKAALMQPNSLEEPNSWVGHLPFAAWLIDQMSPQIFVELGTHSGNSYFSFCQSVHENGLSTRCYAVDTWSGDEQASFYSESVFEQVQQHNSEHYSNFSSLLRLTFDEAVSCFADGSINMLHIDGFHTYAAVRHDFDTWRVKLAPGAIVLFHDTNVHESNFGVWQLWEELKDQYPNHLEFFHSNGLGVLQLEPLIDDTELSWLQPSSYQRIFIDYFSALGARQLERLELKPLRGAVAVYQQEVPKLETQIRNFDSTISQRDEKILQLNNTISHQHEKILQLNNVASQLNHSIDSISQQSKNFSKDVEERTREITMMLNSKSWKITKPLRSINHHCYQFKLKVTKHLTFTPWLLSPKKLIQQLLVGKNKSVLPKGFDPEAYLILNPDVAEIGADPVTHYLSCGYNEGRLFSLPKLHGYHRLKDDRETILIVSHEASRTGAPILTFNLVQHFVQYYNVMTLLLGDGPLFDDFNRTGSAVMVVPQKNGAHGMIDYLTKRIAFKYAIVNSIESRYVLPSLNTHQIPTITLIHEFASYVRPETAFRDAFYWSGDVVFSTQMTLQDAINHTPELSRRPPHVLPQGRCLLPVAEVSQQQLTKEQKRICQMLRPADSDDNTVVIIGAGFVDIRKGVDLFIETAARIIRRVRQQQETTCAPITYRFVWVGKGYDPEVDTRYSVYLSDQMNRSGVKDYIHFIGETIAMQTAYEQADIFFLSSRLDPLPNVAIDAMYSGKPVLCFDNTTGIVEFLKNNDLGDSCVAAYLDVDDMANKVTYLANHPQQRQQIGQKSQRAAQTYFNMEAYVTQLEKIAQQSCKQRQQENDDIQTIKSSNSLHAHFFCPPSRPTKDIDLLIHAYTRAWSCGIGCRKPYPGFHPGIYLEQHGVTQQGIDPYADYLRCNKPQGDWNYPVISAAKTCQQTPAKHQRVALHLHVYYPELLGEIISRLTRNRIRPDLYISITDEGMRLQVEQQLRDYSGVVAQICQVPNLGRDIGPLLTTFGETLTANYDIIGHLHTKKSVDLNDTTLGQNWYNFLLQNLLGSDTTAMADTILSAMDQDKTIGMVFPDDPNVCGWGANQSIAATLSQRMGLPRLPEQFNFPIGTMFWARISALQPFVQLQLDWSDYPQEPLPQDGTILHALERLFAVSLIATTQHIATTHVPGVTR